MSTSNIGFVLQLLYGKTLTYIFSDVIMQHVIKWALLRDEVFSQIENS